ncbi:retrovirus-related Pol polyprotein from type-1 retrotransposable element R2 [Nephila pilipes]|uniref:Retrovirus-related Pol polyprotein from type-1 retrotransposable element R2 n=1 Tax=Nephila pilipes TaxID=299642 RepID=A0A8X6NNP9_NEPPI|nr:retrovirus-related Pol polyprotein from type-1 retrotransposable element R2 [Nephila pilipes]
MGSYRPMGSYRSSTLIARDPGAHLLAAFFNKVLDLSTIPSSWKNAKVVLIPKSGDPTDITNWRPVSLLNTTGKVFSSVLAARLSSWSDINNRLSSFQKGFRENDGCAEHNFLLEQAIGHARRAHKVISMAWLDLENAFGSVPHTFILGALERAGVPESTIALVSALYTGSTSTIRVESGWTDPIPMCAGVRQGCPLSSIIFNLTLEQILRTGLLPDAGFELFSNSISCLAYADDLLIIDSSSAGLQRTIDLISTQANRAGLKFKPSKCAGISADVEKVSESLLAPWQKLTAIRAHVLARAEFLCRNSHIRKRDVADLDKTLVRVGKKILNLPTRANNLVHLSCSKGGAALPEFRSLLDIHAVSHPFRLFASHDPNISGVAAESLRSVVRKMLLRDPTPGECCDFLNGKKDGDFARESGDISTQWSRARHSLQRLSCAIKFEWLFIEGTGYHLNIYRSPNPVCVSPSSAGPVVWILRDEMESHFISQLAGLVDQGKTILAFSSHPASNHFLQAGDYTRFCDWNFLHRARLGCLQLNATRWFGNRDPRCRKCGYARETIPHVLNHCKPHSVAWRKRHDAIQNRVVRAIPLTVGSVTVNKKFPGISTTVIPDLVLRKKSDFDLFIIYFYVRCTPELWCRASRLPLLPTSLSASPEPAETIFLLLPRRLLVFNLLHQDFSSSSCVLFGFYQVFNDLLQVQVSQDALKTFYAALPIAEQWTCCSFLNFLPTFCRVEPARFSFIMFLKSQAVCSAIIPCNHSCNHYFAE